MLIAGLMILAGVLLRIPVFQYRGSLLDHAFAGYIVRHMGAYSDIAVLYFRDHLWEHPFPYLGYTVEYPVLTGLLIWLIGFVNGSLWSYFLASSIVLVAAALVVVWLVQQFDGANPWLLALAPALPLYVVLNWDIVGILFMVAALLMLERDRDGLAGLLLSASVWTKFFPIVVVPLVLLDRALRRRWRDLGAFSATFGLSTLVINLPFALQFGGGGLQLRDSWVHIFRFNQERPIQPWSSNFWNLFGVLNIHVSMEQINRWSAFLLITGVVVTLVVMYLAFVYGYGERMLLPGSLAVIGWFLFINKIYSPQYSLWLAVLLAIVAVPPVLAVGFAGSDLAFFGATWIGLYLLETEAPADAIDWVNIQAVWPAMILRELVTLVIVGWALWQIAGPVVRGPRPTASDDPPWRGLAP